MTRDQILARLDDLIAQCDERQGAGPNPQLVLTGALTLMNAVYGPGSYQVKALLQRQQDITKVTLSDRFKGLELAISVKGALTNLRQEVDAGLLSSIERRVESDVLSDLIQLAREALREPDEGAKNVAAVLAAAAFEDTIRRLAREHAGLIGQDNLAGVIVRLRDAQVLVAPQLGIATSYLKFRNDALHADWNGIERASVASVLAFVEALLLQHFAAS